MKKMSKLEATKSKIEKLNKEFDDFKSLFKYPRLFVRKCFIDLRNEVDKAYEQAKCKDLHDYFENITQKISAFEQECLESQLNNRFDCKITNETNDKIKIIQNILNELNESQQKCDEVLNEISDLIFIEMFKLEAIVFHNKTIMFFGKNLDHLFAVDSEKSIFGALIVINNVYLGTRVIESLKSKLVTYIIVIYRLKIL